MVIPATLSTDLRRLVVLWLGCSVPIVSAAQATYQIGLLPTVNLNHGWQDRWSVNYKVETRQLFRQGTFGGESVGGPTHLLTDQSVILGRKVGLHGRLAAGFLYRLQEGANAYRFTQQYSVTQPLSGYRLAHRVVSDQTLSDDEPTVFRLRYRAVAEVPLNGRSADTKEFYFKGGAEILQSGQRADYELEIRLIPMIGYAVSNNQRIEAGLDHRTERFLEGDVRHSFWWSVNWFLDL